MPARLVISKMRLYFHFVIFALFFIPQANLSAQVTGTVIAVHDGDTFTLLIENCKKIKVRLHGIDCPEKSQDYGQKATQYTSSLIVGHNVFVTITDTDRYGRVVGIVFIKKKKCLNEKLLKAGMAWHYKKYDTNAYWHRLELSAKRRKKGLWAQENPQEPWIYRKR